MERQIFEANSYIRPEPEDSLEAAIYGNLDLLDTLEYGQRDQVSTLLQARIHQEELQNQSQEPVVRVDLPNCPLLQCLERHDLSGLTDLTTIDRLGK